MEGGSDDLLYRKGSWMVDKQQGCCYVVLVVQGLTLAQMLAALTMGKSESALGRTVTFTPGKR